MALAAQLRIGGVSGLIVALSYPIIIALFLVAGTDMPKGEGGEAWLDYVAGHETAWWAIVGLSAFTDVLWIPVAWALYLALRTVDRAWALVGAGLMVLFVILELTVSWPNYAALIDLSAQLSSATTEAQRASIAAAANYAAVMQSSDLLPAYAILIPGLGQLVLGAVMWKGGPFGRAAAWLAIVAGALSVVAVVGSHLWSPLDQVIILGSLLSAVWFAVVGLRMMRLGKRTAA
jgi:hypothetical protein